MSKPAEFKVLDAQLAAQLTQLDALKNYGDLKRDIECEEKLSNLRAIMGWSSTTSSAIGYVRRIRESRSS